MCACAERRAAIAKAIAAGANGDAAVVKAQLGFVASSAVLDMRAVAHSVRLAARARLAR